MPRPDVDGSRAGRFASDCEQHAIVLFIRGGLEHANDPAASAFHPRDDAIGGRGMHLHDGRSGWNFQRGCGANQGWPYDLHIGMIQRPPLVHEPGNALLHWPPLQSIAPRGGWRPRSKGQTHRLAGFEVASQSSPPFVAGRSASTSPPRAQPDTAMASGGPSARTSISESNLQDRVSGRRDFGREGGKQLLIGREARARHPTVLQPSGRDVEQPQAVRSQNPDELLYVETGEERMHVLEHVRRIDEVETQIRKLGEVGAPVQSVAASISEPIEALGTLNHRRCDVDAHHPVEVIAQRLCEPAHPAAEVQSRPLDQGPSQVVNGEADRRIHLLSPCFEECPYVPALTARIRVSEHRPQRIALPERVPGAHEDIEIGVRCVRGRGGRDTKMITDPSHQGARCPPGHLGPTLVADGERFKRISVCRSRRTTTTGTRSRCRRCWCSRTTTGCHRQDDRLGTLLKFSSERPERCCPFTVVLGRNRA